MSEWRVLTGDVRETLATLPAESVQCCVTSPPYWGLRDYGHQGQIGLEPTPEAYVAALVGVFGEVRRVLAGDGVLWLNLGDSYNSNPSNQHSQGVGANGSKALGVSIGRQIRDVEGLKPKDLVGIPWRVAFALQAAGWYLRSDVIWSKPNPMPESVTDRPTKAHEYVFLLSKSEKYFYDAEAIKEQPVYAEAGTTRGDSRVRNVGGRTDGYTRLAVAGGIGCPSPNGRNSRSVWTISTQPYPEAHFATFPEELPTRCIKAGSRIGDTVLDPFTGSGTTGEVALKLGRSFIGCELNPAYVQLARQRIGGAAPLFSSEASS